MDGVLRVDEKTPSGGDYSIMVRMNDDGDIVPEEQATRAIISEYSNEKGLINTTYGVFERREQ